MVAYVIFTLIWMLASVYFSCFFGLYMTALIFKVGRVTWIDMGLFSIAFVSFISSFAVLLKLFIM